MPHLRAPALNQRVAPLGVAGAAVGQIDDAVGGQHAEVHPDQPRLANTGFVVDGVVLHPGDALPPVPQGVAPRVLLLPVAAPWLRLADAVDYARRQHAEVVVPIHDAILSEVGRGLVDTVAGTVLAVAGYRRLVVGEPVRL